MARFTHVIAALLALVGLDAGADEALRAAIAATHRTPAFVARDAVRKPYEELQFLELRPDATVVEISPGGGYWTEILAPYLRDTKDYAKGVWTLPPTLALSGQDREKYVAIGEADNYLLRFRKPH